MDCDFSWMSLRGRWIPLKKSREDRISHREHRAEPAAGEVDGGQPRARSDPRTGQCALDLLVDVLHQSWKGGTEKGQMTARRAVVSRT